jgi:uncharacterized protein (DUF58 family)
MKKWRNAILGTMLVLVGVVSALVTVYAQQREDLVLTSIASIASLLIAALLLIFVVPPLARSARAEVRQIELPFNITKGGLIFLGILAVVAFAAFNTGHNLLFLVLSILLSTFFVAWAAGRASLRELIVSARFPDHIFAGEPAPVIVTLRNRKRLLPSFSIRVEARGPVNQDEKKRQRLARKRFQKRPLAYFMYIPHRAAAEQRVEQLFEKRGHELITGFELSTRFPFGFFQRRRRLRARNVDIIVYPKLEPIGDELHLLPMNAGRLVSVKRGAGHDLLSLRDYQPQDDLRHIDWKATARVRRLTVREFTSEDERRVTIALDIKLLKGAQDAEVDQKGLQERFERGVTLAASLVAHFIAERAEVRLVLGQEAGLYGAGPEQLYDCLRRLALVQPLIDQAEEAATALSRQELHHPTSTAEGNFVILLTTAAPGSLPAHVWRSSHVIYY